MIAKIETTFKCSVETLWNEIQNQESLKFVSSPILTFESIDAGDISNNWTEGNSYKFKLYLYGMIPLGRHDISVVKIDKSNGTIYTNESGTLAKVWNHKIRFGPQNEESIYYIDEIEIKAGVLTFAIWLFALIFYKHRQKRWKKLIKSRLTIA